VTIKLRSQAHSLSGAYVCDALSPDERAAVEEHMAECVECAFEVRELREVAAIMAGAVAQRPPDSLKSALDARIEVIRQVPPIVLDKLLATAPRSGGGRIRANWAVAAVLALLVAGLGWRAVSQQNRIGALDSQSTTISRLLAAPDAEAVRVAVTGGGSALIVDARSRDEAALSFSGLHQAPAGRTYQLWLMAADGSARSVGLMPAAPKHPVLVTGLDGEAAVGMTIEPAGGSARPTTTPVMVAALGV
jgi:anti-sigma-K factor RskA